MMDKINASLRWFENTGKTGKFLKDFDWKLHPLGPTETWPETLQFALSLILHSKSPMFLSWGKTHVQFFNDAFLPFLGYEGMAYLGKPFEDLHGGIINIIDAATTDILHGKSVSESEEFILPMFRNGIIEEVFFTINYTPVKFLNGDVGGVLVICHEITKNMQEALRNENEQLREKLSERQLHELLQLTDSIPHLIWKTDPEGNNTFTTKRWQEYTGIDPDEEGAFKKMVHPDDFENITRIWLDSVKTGNAFRTDVRIKKRNGEYRWFYVHSEPRFGENGIEEWIGAFTDIDDQKQIEQDLMRFRYMADNATDMMIVMREDGTFEYVNTLALKSWGYSKEEIEDMTIFDINPQLTKEKFAQIFRLALQHPITKYQTVHQKKDGSSLSVEININALAFEENTYIFAIARDVSENKKVLEKLKESEERFRTLADTAPVMIWTSGTDKLCNFFNKAWLKFTGNSLEKEYGSAWATSVHPDDYERCVTMYEKCFESRMEFTLEYALKRHDGQYRRVSDSGVPRYANGEFVGYIGACLDIHEQKMFADELEKKVNERTHELKKTNEALLYTNEQLEQFAYVSSHDLQEPLRKIQIYTEIMSGKISDDPAIQNYLSRIKASSSRMTELIKDILNYSKLSKSEQFVTVDLNEILRKVETDFELMIDQKKAVVKKDVLPSIKAIPIQMNQLFYNLMSNALKFSNDHPIIDIQSKVLSDDEVQSIPQLDSENSYLRIIFSDNGIGFEKEYSDRIFIIFQRLNSGEAFGGTGIGLAITKKVIENHDGFICARSEFGKGATFTIYLPIKP